MIQHFAIEPDVFAGSARLPTSHETMNHDPAAATDDLLRAERLTKVHPDGNVMALADVSMSIGRGEFTAIMGPSGSGKSTLLQILGLLDTPTSGEVYFENQPASRMRHTDRVRAEKIGFVFQSFHLLPMLTALENVQVPMFEGRLGPARTGTKAAELLAQVGDGPSGPSFATEHVGRRTPTGGDRPIVGKRSRAAVGRRAHGQPRYEDGRRDHDAVRRSAQPIRHDGIDGDARPTRRRAAGRLVRIRDGRIESDERQ